MVLWTFEWSPLEQNAAISKLATRNGQPLFILIIIILCSWLFYISGSLAQLIFLYAYFWEFIVFKFFKQKVLLWDREAKIQLLSIGQAGQILKKKNNTPKFRLKQWWSASFVMWDTFKVELFSKNRRPC